MKPIYLFREATPLRKLLMERMLTGGGSSVVEDTATGNPLSFLTDLARPLKSVLATWQPHQSGSGDPSPENVRPVVGMDGVTVWHTGKNLLNVAEFVDGKVWWQGVLANGYDDYKASYKIPVVPNAKYTLYKSKTGQNQLQYFDADGQYISQNADALGYDVSKFTIPDGVYFIGINLNNDALATAQLEIGETASEYEPYSGTSYSVAFPVLGKNLLDINVFSRNGITASKVGGKVVLSGTAEGSAYNVEFVRQTLSAGTYTASISGFETGMECVITKDEQWYRSLSSATTFTLTGDALIGGYVRTLDGTEIDATVSIMLEQGSSASAFEPYTRTCYGGTLDLTTGVLTAEWASFSGQWQDGTNETAVGETLKRRRFTLGYVPQTGMANNICNVAPYGSGSSETTKFNVSVTSGVGYAYVTLPNDTSESEDIHIVSKLAESAVVATLSPTQITALIGNNTMWADADNLSVTYLKKG